MSLLTWDNLTCVFNIFFNNRRNFKLLQLIKMKDIKRGKHKIITRVIHKKSHVVAWQHRKMKSEKMLFVTPHSSEQLRKDWLLSLIFWLTNILIDFDFKSYFLKTPKLHVVRDLLKWKMKFSDSNETIYHENLANSAFPKISTKIIDY